MQRILAAHEIPARVINHGITTHFGCGTELALQVRSQDQWEALLLLSPIEEDKETL